MRTPLASVLFLLREMIKNNLLKMAPEDIKKLVLMERSLVLVQTFVNDLLDLQQIKNGVFKLVDEVFDPNETLELISSIFVS